MPADRKSHDYHFVTRWEIPGTCEAVSEVLGDPLNLRRWWPSVYLKSNSGHRTHAASAAG